MKIMILNIPKWTNCSNIFYFLIYKFIKQHNNFIKFTVIEGRVIEYAGDVRLKADIIPSWYRKTHINVNNRVYSGFVLD